MGASLLCGVGSLFFGCGTAFAFRTAAELPEIRAEQPVRWLTDRVEFDVDLSASATIDPPARVEMMARALAVWESAACGRLQLGVGGTTHQTGAQGDGRNTLTIVTQGWAERGFASSAAAYTDVLYEKDADGWHISEADIYVNGVDFDWVASGMTSSEGRLKSLEAVLTHEVGHALGLLHPCEIAPKHREPKCSSDPAFDITMMYPLYDSTKLELSSDDRDGLCAVYGCDVSCPLDPGVGAAGANDSGAAGATESFAGAPSSECQGPDCPGAPRDLGKVCSSTSDCSAGVCLTGAKPHPICSQPCPYDLCSEDWYCAEVDAKRVCVPQDYRAGGGACTFVPGEIDSRAPGEWFVGLMAGACLWRRRREASRRW
ncbi:MAG TPA: hypothetical protein VHB79_34020 [Polyangiaceae bacterium]|nr:hypothetical protein [Polyangiaceae bacterium]